MNDQKKRRYQKEQLDRESGMNGRDEEFAGDLTAPLQDRHIIQADEFREDTADRAGAQSTWLGWLALAAAIVSLFVWPSVLGPVAIVAGVIAFWQGSRALGIWSVVIGLVSLAAYFILVPYYS
jgi:hypothetical protein